MDTDDRLEALARFAWRAVREGAAEYVSDKHPGHTIELVGAIGWLHFDESDETVPRRLIGRSAYGFKLGVHLEAFEITPALEA